MSIEEIIEFVESLGGVLVLRPGPGDGSPEISWGDVFFYYSPDGVVPAAGQPFATVIIKDYPDDAASRLDRPDAFRVNVNAGKEAFASRSGRDLDGPPSDDTVTAHPLYAGQGWLACTNPDARATGEIQELLRTAHALAGARHQRRDR